MGFIGGRQSRAAMLSAKRKGRIVIEFSGTASAQSKPGKCANHIGTNCTSLRPADRLAYLTVELAASLLPGPELASDCAGEAQIWKWG
jgi:hypothetical protein